MVLVFLCHITVNQFSPLLVTFCGEKSHRSHSELRKKLYAVLDKRSRYSQEAKIQVSKKNRTKQRLQAQFNVTYTVLESSVIENVNYFSITG